MPLSTYQYTFVIPQGIKTTIPITVYTTYPSATKDLTGYTSTFVVKDMLSGTILLSLSTGAGGGIVITPASGLVTITILTAQATLIEPSPNLEAQWDLIDPDGEVEERVIGKVKGAEDRNE
jgi:hypothetical protein